MGHLSQEASLIGYSGEPWASLWLFFGKRGTLRAVTCLQPVCPPCQYFPFVLDLLIPGLENALSPLD